jgi:cytochrome c551/c552
MVVLVGTALTAACGKDEKGGKSGKSGKTGTTAKAPAQMSAAAKKAKSIYLGTCVGCHGVNGKGDGPTAKTLTPKPRNYTDPFWQKSVTDAYLKKLIVDGGAKHGKSPLMPGNPALASQPEVLDELVKIIRNFNSKKMK